VSSVVGAPVTNTIPGPTTTPSVTTYYARKSGCYENYYYVSNDDACYACGINSVTSLNNMLNTCNCITGYTIDGTPAGSNTSTNGCSIISVTCNAGQYLPANSSACQICLANNYCGGGTFDYSTSAQGLTVCPNSYVSLVGSTSVNQCGRLLHVDNDSLYLRQGKRTTPSLNFDTNNDGVPDLFGNMWLTNCPINSGTTREMIIEYNNQRYFVCDDTSR
ncbi:MAG: hypothetical protein MJ163_02070, partial [Alphaproteobacteria bacterium]|nr:hypothetical protein [Alphaproteobacteria bacterium]